MKNTKFYNGEYIVYNNGDRYEIGRIKRVVDNGAFVFYSSGDTAAKTPFDCMNKIVNNYVIKCTTLGGNSSEDDIIRNLQMMFDHAWSINMSGNGTDTTRMITQFIPDAMQEIQALRDKVEELEHESN